MDMLNMNLINSAVNLANQYLEAEQIFETTDSLIKRAIEWYTHTEITDEETLAAVIISGSYNPKIRVKEIVEIRDYYFPSLPFEFNNYSIWEIESALKDAEWR